MAREQRGERVTILPLFIQFTSTVFTPCIPEFEPSSSANLTFVLVIPLHWPFFFFLLDAYIRTIGYIIFAIKRNTIKAPHLEVQICIYASLLIQSMQFYGTWQYRYKNNVIAVANRHTSSSSSGLAQTKL